MEEKQNNPRPEEPRKEQANYLPLDIGDQIDERALRSTTLYIRLGGSIRIGTLPRKPKRRQEPSSRGFMLPAD